MMIMYGKLKRKSIYDREVMLVRVQAFDSRVGNRDGNKEKIQGKNGSRTEKILRMPILFAAAAVMMAVCFAVFYFIGEWHISSQEGTVVLESETLSAGTPEEELPTVSGGDIMIIEEETKVPVIVIDPGHGGDDNGCDRAGVMEKTVNLGIALKLAGKLEEMGYEVVLTREDDETSLTLEERVAIAEGARADICVSIHQNACEAKEDSPTGIEVWYCEDDNGESRRLAQLIRKGTLQSTEACGRELQESDELYVIRESSMPSCLIETGFLSNISERELLRSEEYQEKLADGIAWGLEYYFHPKTMYLTFDDGPSEENTAAVLDILKERNIQATFFVVGENVRNHPEVARRIVEEGHTIGIHCNCHEYDKIYQSAEAYLEDFQKAYDAVLEVTGVEPVLFRFPGGSINAYNEGIREDIVREMMERGFIYFDWNAGLEDALGQLTPEELLENAQESTLGRKKIVMLAHDIVYNTTLCLNRLIDEFPEYRMMPLTPEVEPIQF